MSKSVELLIENLYRDTDRRLAETNDEYARLRDSDQMFDRNRAALMLELEIERVTRGTLVHGRS